jgi:hypothetical protein
MVLLAVFKFLTNGNVIPVEILKKLRAHFGVKKLSRTQLYDWSKSLIEG